jgi:hypothetical protein
MDFRVGEQNSPAYGQRRYERSLQTRNRSIIRLNLSRVAHIRKPVDLRLLFILTPPLTIIY